MLENTRPLWETGLWSPNGQSVLLNPQRFQMYDGFRVEWRPQYSTDPHMVSCMY